MPDLIGILIVMAAKVLPWLGVVAGLVLVVVGDCAKSEVRYPGQQHLRTVGVVLLGVSIGGLAAGF